MDKIKLTNKIKEFLTREINNDTLEVSEMSLSDSKENQVIIISNKEDSRVKFEIKITEYLKK
jgi:hypothetical protein